MAAVDYYLEIEGIKGESTNRKHKDTIEILSFSFGATQAGHSGGGGGGGAGKVSFQDLHFTSNVSKASPKLFLACAAGKHIDKAQLFGEQRGEAGSAPVLKITLEDVLISSYKLADEPGDQTGPLDDFSFNFTKIEFEVEGVKATWDLKQNKGA